MNSENLTSAMHFSFFAVSTNITGLTFLQIFVVHMDRCFNIKLCLNFHRSMLKILSLTFVGNAKIIDIFYSDIIFAKRGIMSKSLAEMLDLCHFCGNCEKLEVGVGYQFYCYKKATRSNNSFN